MEDWTDEQLQAALDTAYQAAEEVLHRAELEWIGTRDQAVTLLLTAPGPLSDLQKELIEHVKGLSLTALHGQ